MALKNIIIKFYMRQTLMPRFIKNSRPNDRYFYETEPKKDSCLSYAYFRGGWKGGAALLHCLNHIVSEHCKCLGFRILCFRI